MKAPVIHQTPNQLKDSRFPPCSKSNEDGPQTDPHSQLDSHASGAAQEGLARVVAAWPKLRVHLKKVMLTIATDA